MDKELLKINLLALAGSGLLMLLTGVLLYAFRDRVSPYMRYFLPVPPLGVAAYIVVFNLFKDNKGELPGRSWDVMREVLANTAVSAVVVGAFTICLVFGINALKKYL